ncbi:IS5/IS1182 family transposase [Loigolactobacillus bifermentans]|uniref:IS5/IS1182 family transposase n=1 Tax=Loigolactobacillus bifermentans TaxID=1607 RepID=UPI00070D586A|nr:IS5/IS1182 family transposase [Loigolactobacillus bifermentans]QGG61678.1 IS5/IS1182 family transposase [Loigolactobacillus bifermentans]
MTHIPKRYRHWKAIDGRFRRWSDTDLFLKILEELAKNPDMKNISLDSTSIHVHQKATGVKKYVNTENNQFIGRSRDGLTTKVHTLVDELGNPLKFSLSGGQTHDSIIAPDLLETI